MKQQILALKSKSLHEVTRMHYDGQLDYPTYRAFVRVWEWAAIRFSDYYGAIQDDFRKRHGRLALYRRINKVRRAFGFAPYQLDSEMYDQFGQSRE